MNNPSIPVGEFEQMAAELASLRRRLDTLETPTGTQASTTVSELAQREIYGNEETYLQEIGTSTSLPWQGPALSEITFPIKSPRKVRIEFSVYISIRLRNAGVSLISPTAAIRLHFSWNGVTAGNFSPYFLQALPQSGQTTGITMAQRVTFFDVVDLSTVGTYRVGFIPTVEVLIGDDVGTSPTTVTFQNPRTTVQILGPLD